MGRARGQGCIRFRALAPARTPIWPPQLGHFAAQQGPPRPAGRSPIAPGCICSHQVRRFINPRPRLLDRVVQLFQRNGSGRGRRRGRGRDRVLLGAAARGQEQDGEGQEGDSACGHGVCEAGSARERAREIFGEWRRASNKPAPRSLFFLVESPHTPHSSCAPGPAFLEGKAGATLTTHKSLSLTHPEEGSLSFFLRQSCTLSRRP